MRLGAASLAVSFSVLLGGRQWWAEFKAATLRLGCSRFSIGTFLYCHLQGLTATSCLIFLFPAVYFFFEGAAGLQLKPQLREISIMNPFYFLKTIKCKLN